MQNFLLKTENGNIALNILCMFYQLLTTVEENQRKKLLNADVLRRIQSWSSSGVDKRLQNIALLIVQDFGRRHETIEIAQKPIDL